MNRKITIALILSVLALVGIVTTSAVKAQEGTSYPPLIQTLVDKFNLDTNQVDEVVEDFHQLRQERWQAGCESRLDQFVADGQISEEQKQALLGKKEEMRAQHEAMYEEMKAWAEENGIDPTILGKGKGGFRGSHFGLKKID